MYFESHAHYDDESFDADRDALLSGLPAAGVDYVINVSYSMPSSADSIALAEKYRFVYAAVGVHPSDVGGLTDEDMARLERMCGHEKVVAVGEIGLDYHYDDAPSRSEQLLWFEKQLDLAARIGLPAAIHTRDACEDTLCAVTAGRLRRGVIHCFSGSRETALKYVEMGFYIGVGGVVTYNNARRLREVVEAVPLERILLETDCPYLAPLTKRGSRNDSQNLSYICEKIAQIKHVTNEKVAKTTLENGLDLFEIK